MECLRQKDEDFALDSISSDAFAYFSGLVLPGVSEIWCGRKSTSNQDEAELRGNILLMDNMIADILVSHYELTHRFRPGSCHK
jgi:hypothetical protein